MEEFRNDRYRQIEEEINREKFNNKKMPPTETNWEEIIGKMNQKNNEEIMKIILGRSK